MYCFHARRLGTTVATAAWAMQRKPRKQKERWSSGIRHSMARLAANDLADPCPVLEK